MNPSVKKAYFKILLIIIPFINIYFQDVYFISLVYLLFSCVFITGKIIKQSNTDTYLLFFILLISTIMTLFDFSHLSLYGMFRGIQILGVPIIILYVGAYIEKYILSMKDILQVIGIFGLLYGIIWCVTVLSRVSFSFSYLRATRANSQMIFVAIIFIIAVIMKDEIFSEVVDKLILGLSLFVALVGFSRTNYILFLFPFVVIGMMRIRKKKYFIFTIFCAISFVAVLIFLFIYYKNHTETVMGMFINRMAMSLVEINSRTSFISIEEINSNWRAYEVFQAKKQFEQAGFIQQILGQGYKGVYVGTYASYVGVKGDYLPLLHNGYYSVLTYSGIVGLLLLIVFFVKKIYLFLKNEKDTYAIIYVTFVLAYVFITNTTMGIITPNAMFLPILLIGYLSSRMKKLKG